MTGLANRSGMTLIELVVALVIIGMMASVVAVSGRIARSSVESMDHAGAARVAEARRAALRQRRSVTVEIEANGRLYEATAFPDGRIVADSALDIDPFTGRINGAR